MVREIDELFELLENYDVVATLDTARKRENISNLIDEYKKIPYAFGEVNGGLLGFSKFAKINILNKWPNIFISIWIKLEDGINHHLECCSGKIKHHYIYFLLNLM